MPFRGYSIRGWCRPSHEPVSISRPTAQRPRPACRQMKAIRKALAKAGLDKDKAGSRSNAVSRPPAKPCARHCATPKRPWGARPGTWRTWPRVGWTLKRSDRSCQKGSQISQDHGHVRRLGHRCYCGRPNQTPHPPGRAVAALGAIKSVGQFTVLLCPEGTAEGKECSQSFLRDENPISRPRR